MGFKSLGIDAQDAGAQRSLSYSKLGTWVVSMNRDKNLPLIPNEGYFVLILA